MSLLDKNYFMVRENYRDISLLFSGGIDSTATAIILAERHNSVHLLTYVNGYGHYYLRRSILRYEELSAKFPHSFRHIIIDIRSIFEEITIKHLIEDYKKYKSGFIWCLGCKISMHIRTIIYNFMNGIVEVADGSSRDTEEMIEQMPLTISLIRNLYREYHISFKTPLYEVNRREKERIIQKYKISTGIKVWNRNIGIQPRCIPGELYYLPYVLFGKQLLHREESIREFFKEKESLIKKVIEEVSKIYTKSISPKNNEC